MGAMTNPAFPTASGPITLEGPEGPLEAHVDWPEDGEPVKPVTAVITPSKVSPTRSCMNSHLSQLTTSRVASSARRSVIEHCSPSFSSAASSYG